MPGACRGLAFPFSAAQSLGRHRRAVAGEALPTLCLHPLRLPLDQPAGGELPKGVCSLLCVQVRPLC